jgi:hypothetical protein
MAAKQTARLGGDNIVRRYEKSITLNGQSIYFEQPITDRCWGNIVDVISGFAMHTYNEGVNDTQRNIREVIGL